MFENNLWCFCVGNVNILPAKCRGADSFDSELVKRWKYFLSMEGNSMRLGGPAHGIVTTTVHKTLGGRGSKGGGGPGDGGSV